MHSTHTPLSHTAQDTLQRHRTRYRGTGHVTAAQDTLPRHSTRYRGTGHVTAAQYTLQRHRTRYRGTGHVTAAQDTLPRHSTRYRGTGHVTAAQDTLPRHRTRRYADLQLEFSSAVRTSAEQKELILKLEHDLSTVQTMSSLSRPDAEGADLASMIDTIPEPIKEATAMFAGLGVAPQGELPQGQMDSLLSIISSQRERFRSRNQELESESRSMQVTVQALQSELDSLRADNIKLYEKINDDTVTVRYSSQYEERLDPFASFSKRERQRRYLSLSPWDKATLSLGRGILSNKMARTIAFFYTIFLHCLVFLVLYKTAWSESIGRDCSAFCAKNTPPPIHPSTPPPLHPFTPPPIHPSTPPPLHPFTPPPLHPFTPPPLHPSTPSPLHPSTPPPHHPFTPPPIHPTTPPPLHPTTPPPLHPTTPSPLHPFTPPPLLPCSLHIPRELSVPPPQQPRLSLSFFPSMQSLSPVPPRRCHGNRPLSGCSC
ncbi:unnamed protein product [Coregonus sp. 'balchen']|nr:unnamed protein product [Coregonus sp. 'balchen']